MLFLLLCCHRKPEKSFISPTAPRGASRPQSLVGWYFLAILGNTHDPRSPPPPHSPNSFFILTKVDILVHSLANGPEVTKPLLETSRRGYLAASSASAYSMVSLVQRFGPLMPQGGSVISLTYIASEKVGGCVSISSCLVYQNVLDSSRERTGQNISYVFCYARAAADGGAGMGTTLMCLRIPAYRIYEYTLQHSVVRRSIGAIVAMVAVYVRHQVCIIVTIVAISI